MKNLKEKFVDVVGYEGIYQVSDFGRVKSLARGSKGKDKFLKPWLAGNGYPQVRLCVNSKTKATYVHTLVAESFLGHSTDSGLVVDHLDGNKLNNYLWNIEVVTQRENVSRFRKDRAKLTSQYVGVYKVGKKWASKICIDGKPNYLGLFKTELEAANAYQSVLRSIQ